MKVEEIKQFLVSLVDRELKEEYEYQYQYNEIPSDEYTSYMKKLIESKKWLLPKNDLVSIFNIEADIEKYLK